MDQKTFYRILVDLNQSTHKSKQYLSDKRLTLAEKKIIEGHLLIRNNENEKVLETFKTGNVSTLPFVEGQRNLLLGVAFNNLSYFDEAEEHLKMAARIMDDFQFHHFRFNAWFNLFLVYLNLGKKREMKSVFDILSSIPELNITSQIRLLRCQFLYHSEINEFSKSNEYLHLIKSHQSEMSESDVISHLVSEFMFYIKQEDFNKCKNTLGEMKKHRKFQLTENYNFMKTLLEHLTDDKPIYAYDHEFKNTPILFHELKVIQSFESGELEVAEEHWKKLQKISDKNFGELFCYEGPKSLFSLCLDKHLKNKKDEQLLDVAEGLSKKDILIKIIRQSKAPISKEKLFEMIWGKPVSDKDDLKRLARLIYKVKNENNIEIQSRKGAYFIKAA